MRKTATLILLLCAGFLAYADDLSWRSVETEHFSFIYRARDQWAVDELVTFAEDVYDDVTGFFDSAPPRIPVLLFGETDLANGYYSPAPPQHVGLYLVQPSLPWMGARTESWLRLLLTHELTHFVHANFDRGVFHAVGSLFGRSLTGLSLGLQPMWTTEGLAVNTETIFTDGGRGTDPFFEMEYKAPVIEGRLFSLAQAGYNSHLAPTGRYYVAGYFIWEYLLREYGRDYASELLADVSGFPFFGVWGPIRRTAGTPMGEIYDEIEADLARRYARAAEREPAERVSPAVRSNYYLPTQTEQGLYLYRTRTDRRPAIVRFDPESGEEAVLVEMPLTDHASWSATADGETLAFATISANRAFPEEQAAYSDLYLSDVRSDRITQITTGGGYYHPALSPDGSYVVAVERIHGHHRLVRFDLGARPIRDGAVGDRNVLWEPDRARLHSPAVSPDGSTVVVVVNQGGFQQLALLEIGGGQPRLLPRPESGVPYFPVFEDDTTLLYGNDRGGELALYRHDLETDNVTRIATDPVGVYAGRPADGEIVLGSYTSDGYTLRRTPADGGAHDPAEVPTTGPSALERHDSPPAAEWLPYTPLPGPALWLPAFDLAGPWLDLMGFGAGAFVYGADYLGRNTWQLSSVYLPGYGQLSYDALWSTRYGPFAFQTGAHSRYAVTETLEQSVLTTLHQKLFQHHAYVAYDLLSRSRLGSSNTISVGAGANHQLLYVSGSSFGLGGIASAGVSLDLHRVVAGVDLTFVHTPLSSQQAYHAPGATRATLSFLTPLNLPGFSPLAHRTQLRGSGNLGLFASDHVLSFDPTVSYATALDFAAPVDLRGFEGRTAHDASHTLRGRFHLALDYKTPHLLVDIPLAASVGITEFGLGLFAEATGGYEVATPEFALDRHVSFGGELTTILTYLTDIPITVGLAVRIDAADPGSFGGWRDVGFYIQSDLVESIPIVPRYLSNQQ
ncbi:MAG: hypothetical protein ACOCXN_01420 [Spirochaetota bacterium]